MCNPKQNSEKNILEKIASALCQSERRESSVKIQQRRYLHEINSFIFAKLIAVLCFVYPRRLICLFACFLLLQTSICVIFWIELRKVKRHTDRHRECVCADVWVWIKVKDLVLVPQTCWMWSVGVGSIWMCPMISIWTTITMSTTITRNMKRLSLQKNCAYSTKSATVRYQRLVVDAIVTYDFSTHSKSNR